ncbi:solute carrier family 51 subunit beta isoform X2 [Micropterus salmoides]|uniref:solute carrier family 51 subunit beta isoform X2 n=1 Tax=Micropterus salmoides TaxID=27706 RepID=UPI0018EAC0C0|nr:solute carrier family 51 subunit beta isoform X2 [Micropterus salmoides]
MCEATDMLGAWISLFPLLLGARAFMIHNTQCSLCLEDSAATGEVLLKKCNLDSESQQWIWIDHGMLMCVTSSRCLSALQREPVQTRACQGPEVNDAALVWDCDRDRLISRNTSLLLSINGQRVILTHDSKHSKWRSLDEGDICQEKLRSRRASDDPEEFEAAEEQTGELRTMTEEEREYLRWYYRTEDPTTWKFVLLGLAFVCLLIGFLLLGMGAMASKNRKKIAKYKAAAARAQKSEGEEMLVVSPHRDDSSRKSSLLRDMLLHGNLPSSSNGEVSELKAGNIVLTWKDGNTSNLYSDPAAEEEKREEVSAAELEADEAVKTME